MRGARKTKSFPQHIASLKLLLENLHLRRDPTGACAFQEAKPNYFKLLRLHNEYWKQREKKITSLGTRTQTQVISMQGPQVEEEEEKHGHKVIGQFGELKGSQ